MKNWIWFEIRMFFILMAVILVGIYFGGIKVKATNVQKFMYQASAEYDQRNEQDFRDKISQRIQELEGR